MNLHTVHPFQNVLMRVNEVWNHRRAREKKKSRLTIQDALEKEKCQYPHAPLRSIPKLDFPLFTPHTLSTAFSWSPTQNANGKVKTKASPDFLCQWLERISTVRIMRALLRPVVAHEGCADVLVWLSWLKLGCSPDAAVLQGGCWMQVRCWFRSVFQQSRWWCRGKRKLSKQKQRCRSSVSFKPRGTKYFGKKGKKRN